MRYSSTELYEASKRLSNHTTHFVPQNFQEEAEIWRRIFERLLPYWKVIVLAVILVAVVSAAKPLMAVIMKPLLDERSEERRVGEECRWGGERGGSRRRQ